MKLKRLLLRYDPAGIGLECANDAGEISVIHKDLPKRENDTEDGKFSQEEVSRLALQIIEGEPDLLSAKKHLQALTQLLCRLYQLEAEAVPASPTAPGEPDRKEKKRKSKGEELPTHDLNVGDKVLLAGLKSPNQGFNNYIGTIVKILDKGKVEVVPEGASESEPIKTKAAPLLKLQDRPLGSGKPGDMPAGTKVSITRLRNHGALNGTVGRVVEFNNATLRYEVRALETGQLFRVKPDNVVPLFDQDEPDSPKTLAGTMNLPPAAGATSGAYDKISIGCYVVLQGLKNAAWLNGQEAEVLAIDNEKSRLDIKLNHDGSVKKVKIDNVKFIRPPSEIKAGEGGDEFTPGQIVQLCGLRSAAALNGEKAEIRRKDPGSDRYEIRLELDGSTKKVRRENLQTI